MKRILRIVIIFLIFIITLLLLNKLVTPKYMTNYIEGNMIKEYYDEKIENDVIFIGDCEVYANFSPINIYEESGITSYVRGNSQQLIWQSYYLLKETIKYQKIKVLVFSVNAMRYSEPVKEEYNRLMMDKMRFSKEKLEMIKASKTSDESTLSYLFPLLRYHSRITSLSSEDFEYFFKEEKHTHNGFLINQDIKPLTTLPNPKKLSSYAFSDNVYYYLDKIYELCVENGIKLVLVKAPSLHPYWYPEYESNILNYIKDKDIKYYNLLDKKDEIGLDYQIDTYDGGLHLNLNGATKLSKYFAKILRKDFNLNDYRNNTEINEIYNDKIKRYYNEINKKFN